MERYNKKKMPIMDNWFGFTPHMISIQKYDLEEEEAWQVYEVYKDKHVRVKN